MTTFPSIATRGHRPRKDAEARVMLSGSTVKPFTAQAIDKLMIATNLSRGEVIDYLVVQAIAARPLSTAARAATNSQSLRVQRVPTPLSSVKSKHRQ